MPPLRGLPGIAEVLGILQRALTWDALSLRLKFYSLDNINLLPRPVQVSYPELRIAVSRPRHVPAKRQARSVRNAELHCDMRISRDSSAHTSQLMCG